MRRNVKNWVTMCHTSLKILFHEFLLSVTFLQFSRKNIFFDFFFILLCIKNYLRPNVKKWVTMCNPSLKILFHEFLLLVEFLLFSPKNIFLFIILCIKIYIRRNVKKWVKMCQIEDFVPPVSTFSCIFIIFSKKYILWFYFMLLCIKNNIRRNVKKWVTLYNPSSKILFHEFLLLVGFLLFSPKNIFLFILLCIKNYII
jgi:hypothetical protein